MPWPFWKMCGSGNDFIVFDNREGRWSQDDLKRHAQILCRRRLSVGADGILVMEAPKSLSVDFRMRLFNPDGSEGEMCGNGARCLARYFHEISQRTVTGATFETLAGPVAANILEDGSVRLLMPSPSPIEERRVSVKGKDQTVYHMTLGVPHTVLLVEGVFTIPSSTIQELGQQLRHDPQFEKGTNVNFAESKQGEIHVRTYERGVEDETLACGTGSTASALALEHLGMSSFPVVVKTRGGLLRVERLDGNLYLTGEARFIYQGVIYEEALATPVPL
jgi:diaminopimelate epimerase